ncbi:MULTISPECIES: DNA polymerase III subunit epsilon [unclassified Methylophaga]|jgi:DNA polymerase-3 subunit epsilon|uniref:DNA polymerase III subunit epsilon n=2 Tax=Methylophaga TaxID=40222 RepID=UPI000C94EB6C|nr:MULTISPECIES: DNA polymerase III subunit epsilon [unclassified Methylophaga]MAY17443.1 DNA polymerase III subunit epsilon [Methylophaga sp.]|tara:strand:- start:32 stop:757 length:726 start_codon:yes stop_codon:yes gene_type:complete
MAEQTSQRQIVLDTETTGLSTADDHRIIEIGCVELVNRRLTGETFHQYINPQRAIDAGAMEVHGITNESLADKPVFADIAEDFLRFIEGAELIIHNAAFDVGFLNHEFTKLGHTSQIEDICSVLDTLKLARDKHPGQKNNLDALCKRYGVDNSNRELHGALLDAEILADVYLMMTGGQVSLSLAAEQFEPQQDIEQNDLTTIERPRSVLKVIQADTAELAAHQMMLEKLQASSDGNCVWLK